MPESPKSEKRSSPARQLGKSIKRKVGSLFHHHVTPPRQPGAASRAVLLVSSAASTPSTTLFAAATAVVHDAPPSPCSHRGSHRTEHSDDTLASSSGSRTRIKSLLFRRSRDTMSSSHSSHPSTAESSVSPASHTTSLPHEERDREIEERQQPLLSEPSPLPPPPPPPQQQQQQPPLVGAVAVQPEPTPQPPTSSSLSEPMPSSPPTAFVEPEVPDPFLIDDEEGGRSDDGKNDVDRQTSPVVSESQQTIMPSHEIALTPVEVEEVPVQSSSPLPKTDKDVPPPPPQSDSDEEEAPDLYVPKLVIPTMFLPVPNTDPLTTLLTKYIYPPEKRPVRDVTGDWKQNDFHTMVMNNSWRALAKMARDRIVASNPADLSSILSLWYLRLASLARLRLFNQTTAECGNLFDVLEGIEPPEARDWVFDRVLPFELEVMQARLKYWANDPMGYLDALNALLKKCKSRARAARADTMAASMWKERGSRVCLIIASQMVEMKEYMAAVHLLQPLCSQGETISTAALRSSIGRIYLQCGDTSMAEKHFAIVAADPGADKTLKDMNAALLAMAQGQWAAAGDILEVMLQSDSANFAAVNNLAVALLGQGKVKEGIEVLETALGTSPSTVVVAEPFLFNLSTLYELHSATALENKQNLLIEVAKWSGDGLRVSCLKLPTN